MVYGFGTATANNSATGNNNIDGLLSNRRWASNNVTYSFTSNFQNDYEDESGYPNSAAHNATFASLNATQRTAVRDWVGMYESVSGLNLIELGGVNDRHATIRMARSEHPGTVGAAAYAYYPSGSVQGGDVWFDRSSESNPVLGNRVYRTVGHELGHALGLKHGQEGGGVNNVPLNANRDSMEFSIMTYRSYVGDNRPGYHNETYGFAQSLMMHDIRAIQELYGANFNSNAGNTTYSFSTTTGEMSINGVGQGQPGSNRIFRTIWDGNGTDTYNFSNYSTNLNVNLAPGRWSDLDVGGNAQRAYLGDGNYARGHVFNALQYNGDTRSLIENAYGGSGNDRMYGNNANNFLWGNTGNDIIYGFNGNDILSGSAGNDSIYGGNGQDSIWGGSGNDFISGGSGDDFMDGGAGIDTVDYRHWDGGGSYNLGTGFSSFVGFYTEDIRNFENIYTGDGADIVVGTNGANRIYTGDGNDFVAALDGNDYISAGNGNDTVYGGAGNDFILGGSGDDFMDGGTGIDTVDYRHWNGGGTYNMTTEIASFAGFYNEEIRNFENIYTGTGNDVVIGNAEDNRIITSDGNDIVNAGSGDDYILGGRGNDSIVGGLGNDYINGTTRSAQGTGERDILSSGSYGDTDTFVLGESGRVFYNDQGNLDHAVMRGFDVHDFFGDIADKIQLVGSAASYSLGNVSVNGVAGAGIHFAGDLIGIVQNVNAASLNLANTNHFSYV